jgi:hypothetical protein
MQYNSRWKRTQKNLLGNRDAFYSEYGKPYLIDYDLRALGDACLKVVLAENYKNSHNNSIFR